jgi:hypothetical protein
MAQVGTGHYSYELVPDFPKLPADNRSASSAESPPIPATVFTCSSARMRPYSCSNETQP